MKILVTVHGFLTPSMTFVYNQIKTYLAEGHEVEVVACEIINPQLFPFNNITRIEEKRSLSFFVSKLKRGLKIEYSLYNSDFIKQFRTQVTRFDPDIIHVQFGVQLIRVFPAIKELGIPIVTTFHGYDASKYLRNGLYVKKLKQIMDYRNVHATTVSNDMKYRLELAGINVSRTYVDYLGVDTTFFKPEEIGQHKNGKLFLQVSNFVEKKGHEYTVKAFGKYLRETNATNDRLVLAGIGPLLSKIQNLTETEGISDKVEFPGLINRDQVKGWMLKADCFLHHSITSRDGDMEGLPTVIMEAMAMELPVISTYHAGIPELIDHKKYGILVQEKDVFNYAKSFSIIPTAPIKSSRIQIKSSFDLYTNTRKILRIFDQIINEN